MKLREIQKIRFLFLFKLKGSISAQRDNFLKKEITLHNYTQQRKLYSEIEAGNRDSVNPVDISTN